jgi:hypothetical protein
MSAGRFSISHFIFINRKWKMENELLSQMAGTPALTA